MTPAPTEARAAKRALARLARPVGTFDAARYFRDAGGLGFYNVGTDRVRTMARAIADRHKGDWTVREALAFADALITDKHLEVKGLGIEVVAHFRRDFTPALLPAWKRWLADNHSANWATTDAICGLLIGPLVATRPEPRCTGIPGLEQPSWLTRNLATEMGAAGPWGRAGCGVPGLGTGRVGT